VLASFVSGPRARGKQAQMQQQQMRQMEQQQLEQQQAQQMEKKQELNGTCKCCRMSRVKCDMPQCPSGRCTRCTRLDLVCVAEARRSSAKTRLGPKCREMMQGESTALTVPPKVSTLVADLPADIRSPSVSGDLAFCATVIPSLLGKGLSQPRAIEPGLMEFMVKVLVEVSVLRDHCGLMSFAMQRACELGLSLSKLLPWNNNKALPAPGSRPADLPLPVAPPPAVMQLVEAPTSCFVRIISDMKPWTMPNAICKAWLEARDTETTSFDVPLKIMGFLESDEERHRMLRLLAKPAQAQMQLLADGTRLVEVQDDVPFNLPFRPGELEALYGADGSGSALAHEPAVATATVLPQPKDVVRELRAAWGTSVAAGEAPVPHVCRIRIVKPPAPGTGATFFCLSFTPITAPPLAWWNAAKPTVVEEPPSRKRLNIERDSAPLKRPAQAPSPPPSSLFAALDFKREISDVTSEEATITEEVQLDDAELEALGSESGSASEQEDGRIPLSYMLSLLLE